MRIYVYQNLSTNDYDCIMFDDVIEEAGFLSDDDKISFGYRSGNKCNLMTINKDAFCAFRFEGNEEEFKTMLNAAVKHYREANN